MRKLWILICFLNFFVASVMGLLLRWMYVAPISGVNFQFLMHGHSHVAMLGWVYLMLYCLLIYFYISKEEQKKPVYNRLFWVTELAVVGMMLDFPAQGYAFVSIMFSTLHIFCSYYFCYLIYKNAQTNTFFEKKMLATALFFMIFSTLGVWCLGPAVGMMGKTSAFYQIAIQFFLHFQFNGWFLFGVLLLFFKQAKLVFDDKKFEKWHRLFVVATVLTFAFPVSWSISHPFFYWTNCLGVILQLVAIVTFINYIQPQLRSFLARLSTLEKAIYRFTLFSFILKTGIQLVVLFPELFVVSHEIRNFVIGYIHLTMLGVVTGFLFGFSVQNGYFSTPNLFQKWGVISFGFGFLTTEILLFLQGIWLYWYRESFSNYYPMLFVSSLFLSLGLGILTIGIFQLKSKII